MTVGAGVWRVLRYPAMSMSPDFDIADALATAECPQCHSTGLALLPEWIQAKADVVAGRAPDYRKANGIIESMVSSGAIPAAKAVNTSTVWAPSWVARCPACGAVGWWPGMCSAETGAADPGVSIDWG